MWWGLCEGLEGVGFYVFCSVPSVCTNGLLSGWISGFGNFFSFFWVERVQCASRTSCGMWHLALRCFMYDKPGRMCALT